VLTKLQVAYDKFGGWLGVLSNIILVGAMLLTVINVLLRRFGTPFAGTSEVVGFSSATLTGLALVYSQKRKAHIAIDIITAYFNRRVRAVVLGVGLLVGTAMFSMAAWQVFVRAGRMVSSGLVSETMHRPYYHLLYLLGCCLVFFAIRLIIDALLNFQEACKK